MKRYHQLSDKEQHILEQQGTEPPFSEEGYVPGQEGIYLCRRCDAPLYLSADRFASGCGWPSFDDGLPHAIYRRVDADGERMEILCRKCRGHLGHVFEKEGFTSKNVRHCVNSLSLRFIAAKEQGRTLAAFAGGCFWGVEALMQSFSSDLEVISGYMGGDVVYPTYEQVCTGLTGHKETVKVLYDEKKISFAAIAQYFLEIHDPTQKNGQGPDLGEQYQSVIFYYTPKQRDAAAKLLIQLAAKNIQVATKLEPASMFYKAEQYHQGYYKRTGKAPYCHHYVKRF